MTLSGRGQMVRGISCVAALAALACASSAAAQTPTTLSVLWEVDAGSPDSMTTTAPFERDLFPVRVPGLTGLTCLVATIDHATVFSGDSISGYALDGDYGVYGYARFTNAASSVTSLSAGG